jgi:hypothetical protein
MLPHFKDGYGDLLGLNAQVFDVMRGGGTTLWRVNLAI